MKKTNLYYATVYKRPNSIKMAFLGFFLMISSWPRTFIENFTRSKMGLRYFSMPLCAFLSAFLFIFPFAVHSFSGSIIGTIGSNLTWYIYTAAYLFFALKRNKEVKTEKGVYHFNKFTLYTGDINPIFYQIRIFGKELTRREIATMAEPIATLFIGLILMLFKQAIGNVLVFSAVVYAFSWSAQYYIGDQFILDTIDEMICNEELVNTFVHGMPTDKTKGFEVHATAPDDKSFRQKMADYMMNEEPAAEVI